MQICDNFVYDSSGFISFALSMLPLWGQEV